MIRPPASGFRFFYPFLGSHSLLIGLLPFFIPVWLMEQKLSLAAIFAYIAISGFSFCAALRLWETLAHRFGMRSLLLTGFAAELLLVALVFQLQGVQLLLLLGCANGLYNAFFWTTQRVMFAHLVVSENSGRHYGNFQLFVALVLKVGILIGGVLLERSGVGWILLLSLLVSVGTLVVLDAGIANLPSVMRSSAPPLPWHRISGFRDSFHSRRIFVVDGFFLFLESHLWTISLFLLSAQNFTTLGILVIGLAALFGVIFYASKNHIDRLAGRNLYAIAVLLYGAGWLLRAVISDDSMMPAAGSWQWLAVVLILVTFFTSFFRLAYNKRFFDIANLHRGESASHASEEPRFYIVVKSYYTQCAIGVGFSILAVVSLLLQHTEWTDLDILRASYLAAALLAPVFLWYREPPTRASSG